MCGGSSHRRITADERQSANGGEGGSKTCGRHVDGSGAEAGKESTTRRQAGVGLSTHGGVGGQGQLPRAWREGATWSYSEPKVGNFRIFAPPIHVAALWPAAFGFRGDSNNRTECAVVLIRFANLKNEETNRNKDNCTFGSVV